MSVNAVSQNYCGDYINKLGEVASKAFDVAIEMGHVAYEKLLPYIQKMGEWCKSNSSFIWTAAISSAVTIASTIACAFWCCTPARNERATPQNLNPSHI